MFLNGQTHALAEKAIKCAQAGVRCSIASKKDIFTDVFVQDHVENLWGQLSKEVPERRVMLLMVSHFYNMEGRNYFVGKMELVDVLTRRLEEQRGQQFFRMALARHIL